MDLQTSPIWGTYLHMTSVEVAELWKILSMNQVKKSSEPIVFCRHQLWPCGNDCCRMNFPVSEKGPDQQIKDKTIDSEFARFLKAPRRVFPKELLPNSSFSCHLHNTSYILYTLRHLHHLHLLHLHHIHNLHLPHPSYILHLHASCTFNFNELHLHHIHHLHQLHLQVLNVYISPTKLLKCHLHMSWYTGVLTQEFLHTSCCTGHSSCLHRSCYTAVVSQEFLHRSYLLGDSTVSDLLQNSYLSSSSESSLWVARAARPCPWKRDPLQRLRMSDARTCGKCDFSVDGRRPLARNNGRRSKTGVNLEVWNLRCNRFELNEKLTAKTCLKLRFGNVKENVEKLV